MKNILQDDVDDNKVIKKYVISAKGIFYMMNVNILRWEVIKLNKQTNK